MSAIASPPQLCPRCGITVEPTDRFCRGCGASLGAAPSGHELRKTVSVVFCDLVGSTALGERLDPEALRHVLGRYYAQMRAVLELHGGLVEKFIGDAVVAVFGVPLVHEDDALRAVRAAVEMRAALDCLNDELEQESGVRLGVRIGVNTGEVVAGDLGPGASFASGDAVNVAARLEQAAAADEVLVGERTEFLVREAAELEPVEPLELHGKSEPVQAFRLLSVAADAEAIVRHFETAFFGRERELAALADAFEEAVAEPGCRLVTVLGEPGIGKTRLLREFAGSVPGRTRVLSGSCLPYGEGITYWPLREIVHELCRGEDLGAELTALLADEQRAEHVAGLILGAIGASSNRGGSVEEVQWAVRRLFEALAAERPLLVVLEDLHWAEPTFLQLVEYIAAGATDAPILLLAAAREELLDQSPGWSLPHPHSRLLPLEPLPETEAGALVDALAGPAPVPEQLRTRLVGTGGGNPLFLEQLVALQAENGGGELPLPATITALLVARLDRVPTPERDLLERAAVEGLAFHRSPLTALLPDHEASEVGALLLDAVRRNLIRSCKTRFPGDDAYEFVHVLVRNAVYDAMPKELRAQLHEQFAETLEHTVRSGELDEIVGYHLEQAAHAKQQLGRSDPALADRAGEKLAAAGREALCRDDRDAAASLLERSLRLTRRARFDVALETDLANAVGIADLERAAAIAGTAATRARSIGDVTGEAHARVVAAKYRSWTGEVTLEALEREARTALPLLERAGDQAGLAEAWEVLFSVGNARARWGEALAAIEQAIEHAGLAGRHQGDLFDWLATALLNGPWRADEALRRIDQQIPEPRSPYVLGIRAILIAALGRFAEAWQEANEQCRRLTVGGYSGEMTLACTAMVAGEDEIAARHWKTACEEFEALDNYNLLEGSTHSLGRSLFLLGRSTEAERVCDEAERLAHRRSELGRAADPDTELGLCQLRALARAHRGEYAEGERLAREAVRLAEQMDSLLVQGDAYFDLARVLEAAGRPDEAAAAYREALERYERKRIVPLARRTRERLAALPRESAHLPMSSETERATIATGSSTTEGGRDGHRVQPTGRARGRREDQRPPRR
ncbi:MAG TPA: AAA family ATPase [Gaiellaceae bacterium]